MDSHSPTNFWGLFLLVPLIFLGGEINYCLHNFWGLFLLVPLIFLGGEFNFCLHNFWGLFLLVPLIFFGWWVQLMFIGSTHVKRFNWVGFSFTHKFLVPFSIGSTNFFWAVSSVLVFTISGVFFYWFHSFFWVVSSINVYWFYSFFWVMSSIIVFTIFEAFFYWFHSFFWGVSSIIVFTIFIFNSIPNGPSALGHGLNCFGLGRS